MGTQIHAGEGTVTGTIPEDPEILMALYKIVCRQTNCADRGFDEYNCGKCAFCADTAEDVIGTYFKLKAARSWSSSFPESTHANP